MPGAIRRARPPRGRTRAPRLALGPPLRVFGTTLGSRLHGCFGSAGIPPRPFRTSIAARATMTVMRTMRLPWKTAGSIPPATLGGAVDAVTETVFVEEYSVGSAGWAVFHRSTFNVWGPTLSPE